MSNDLTTFRDNPRAEVAFVADQEPMSIYRFDDGTVLKTKHVLMNVERVEGMYNVDGSPMYLLSFNQCTVVVASDAMKRKP